MTTEDDSPTVEHLATELSRAFERRTREAGHEPGLDHYTALKEGSPDWMKDACRAAHDAGGDLMLPDDWRYEFIEDAADALAEHEGDEDRARDYLNESDHYCYTWQQTGWLHSHNARSGYVDEAVSSGLVDGSNTTQAIRVGMLLEQEEVLAALLRFLDNLTDERDEEEGG